MTGYVSRTCGATGVWSEPEDSCRTQMCEPVTINRMSNGCMNLKFEPAAMPYVRVNVVPSSSPDLSMVFRGRTVRICGLEVKVAYWMLVELETDVSACSADFIAEEMRACLGASVLIRKRCWLWNNRVVSVVFVSCKGVC